MERTLLVVIRERSRPKRCSQREGEVTANALRAVGTDGNGRGRLALQAVGGFVDVDLAASEGLEQFDGRVGGGVGRL